MIVRTKELKKLEMLYTQSRNHLVLLYGAKGCEKEALIKEFCKNKKCFYYRGRNASAREQLKQMQDEIERQYKVKLSKDSYEECFTRIKSNDASKLVVVIDEFQNIAKKDEQFFQSIIKLKNKQLYPGPVMILLCNSSLTWTNHEMGKNIGDGAREIDEIMRLQDVGFLDIVRNFPEYTVEQCVQVYGILGGVPKYLNAWNGKKSVKENICNLILKPNGALFSEAEEYISTELRELSVYDTILASLARGNEKLNDLYNDTGYSRAKISVYMKNLSAFSVVNKVISFETGGWENAKKGIYRISHNYVNFYFRFIYPHLSDLYTMSTEQFYQTYIANELDAYLHRYFVQVCQEYLQLLNRVNKLPIHMEKMGVWLGKTGTIDIIGQDRERNRVVAICNWILPQLTMEQYAKLLETMKSAKITATTIYLFSAKGFDEQLIEAAKDESDKIVLVDMKEL